MAQSDEELLVLALQAKDEVSPQLNAIQKVVEELTWWLINLENASKIDFRELTWSQRQLALLHNSIISGVDSLQTLKDWTLEYNVALNKLTDDINKFNSIMWELQQESVNQVQEQLLQQNWAKNVALAQESVNQALEEQSKVLSKVNISTLSNSQAQEYWQQRINNVKNALETQIKVLQAVELQHWKNSEQANKQREAVEKLQKEYKETSNILKNLKKNQWFWWDSLDIVTDKIKQNLALSIGKSIVSTAIQWIKEMGRNIIEYWKQISWVAPQFEQMATRAWMSYTKLRDTLRESSNGMVSDIDLMQSANRAMSLWVAQDIESMSNLMKIAQVRWAQMWETTSKAFDDIVTWIGRQSAMILDNLWIVINSNDAYERYAKSIGKTVDQLSKQEKVQAITNEVIRKSAGELKARENMPLTIAQKIDKLKVSAINNFAAIWWAFFKRTEPMLDEVIRIADETTTKITEVTDNFNDGGTNIRNGIATMLWNIRDSVSETASNVRDTLSDMANTIFEWIWDLADEFSKFFWWVESDSQSSALTLTQYFVVWLQTIWKLVQAVSIAFQQLWKIAKGWFSTWKKVLTNILGDLKDWKRYEKLGAWFKALNPVALAAEYIKQAWTDITNNFNDIIETGKEFWEDWKDWYTDLLNDNEELLESFKKKWWSSALWDRITSIFWDDNDNWGWGSKKGKETVDAYKKVREEMNKFGKQTKEIHKANEGFYQTLDRLSKEKLKELQNTLKETEKEFEKATDEVQDKIDDTVKNIEKLEDEIENLNQKLADLWKDENTSLAKEIVKEQEELKKLEKQYTWITDIAKNTSRDEINNSLNWDYIGWFEVENVKKAKQYVEGLAWAYDWMSDEQIDALKEEIKYQEWFNSLNPIEKIKEEYNVKRKEIQAEIEEKRKALEAEYELKKQYENELLEIQEKYTPLINQQKQEIENLWNLRNQFEQEYYEYIKTNGETELSYASQLEIAWKKVADARKSAWASDISFWWDIEWYADWGSVIAWKPILVWERWPELFVPKSNWDIIKNSDLKGGTATINISFWDVILNNWMDEEQFSEFLIWTIKNINLWYI